MTVADMRLSIEVASHLRLARLAPAFPMTVTATRGTAVMRRDGFARTLVAGVPCGIAPFQAFDLLVAGSIAQPAGCRIEIALASDGPTLASLHQELSRHIFLQPELPWSAAFAAGLLGESPDRLRRMLFAEGAAFGDLCRTQRLMRLMFEAPHGLASLPSLKRGIGWPPGHDLESSLHDRLGITLDLLRRATASHAQRDTGRPARAVRPAAHYWPSLSPA
ncbi:MAG: AraC family transcriptional regulator [Cupriavidus sp.]|nr:AraC family transcriptional regulator [Cupriavidus sp.]